MSELDADRYAKLEGMVTDHLAFEHLGRSVRATMKRSTGMLSTSVVTSLVVLLAVTVVGSARGQEAGQQDLPELEIVDREFAFTGVDEEQGQALYTWSMDVANHEEEAQEVIATLELIDADDQVVHTDRARVEVEAEGLETVEGQGSLSVETARAVASYRNGLRIPQSTRTR